MLDRWVVALDDRKYVIAIFLDFSKAFDTIDHELLLLKLTRYSFSSLSIQLIRRRFYVCNLCYLAIYVCLVPFRQPRCLFKCQNEKKCFYNLQSIKVKLGNNNKSYKFKWDSA